MSTENKKPEVVFMPGCFDDFDGTQEELDELIETIKKMANSGELKNSGKLTDSELVGVDLSEDTDLSEEDIELFMNKLQESAEIRKRALH